MNLIICHSPLQVLIAERIIQLFPNEDFYGMMLTYFPTEKNLRYYKRLEKNCKKAFLFPLILPKNKKSLIQNCVKARFFFKKEKKFRVIFVANIEHEIIHYLLSSLKNFDLKTFDDGTVNITKAHHITKPPKYSLKNKLFRLLLGVKYNTPFFLKNSTQHFSIYKGFKNIFPNPTFIDLFEKFSEEKTHHTQKKSILLGQPIFGKPEKNTELFNKIINSFSMDYYLPHPRENYQIENIEYLKTPFILEDFLLNELKENSHILYEVYSISSSAVLNVLNFPNVKIYAIEMENLPADVIEIQNLFRQTNIEFVNGLGRGEEKRREEKRREEKRREEKRREEKRITFFGKRTTVRNYGTRWRASQRIYTHNLFISKNSEL